MITNIFKKSKNHDIVGALGYMLTYHKAMVFRRVRNSVECFFSRRCGQFSLIFSESIVSYFISVDGQTNSEIC